MHAERSPEPSVLLMNGTVGVGKTSVAEGVGDLLTDAEMPHAVIDLDWLRHSWPTPSGDRFNFGTMLRNLRSITGDYFAAGAVRLVLAGMVEAPENRKLCGDALDIKLSVCRLMPIGPSSTSDSGGATKTADSGIPQRPGPATFGAARSWPSGAPVRSGRAYEDPVTDFGVPGSGYASGGVTRSVRAGTPEACGIRTWAG